MATEDCSLWTALSLVGICLFIASLIVNILTLTKQARCRGRMQSSIEYVQTTMRRHRPFKMDETDEYTSIEEMMKKNKSPVERPYSSLKLQDSKNRDTYLEPDVFKELASRKNNEKIIPKVPPHGPSKVKKEPKIGKMDEQGGNVSSDESSGEHDYECPASSKCD